MVIISKEFIEEFIDEYNDAGGLNEGEDYENAVCFALTKIYDLPNVKMEISKDKYPFLVKHGARLAVFQNVVRLQSKYL